MEYTFADGGKAVVEGIDPFATFIQGSKRAAQFSGNVHAATVHIYKGKEINKSQIELVRAARTPQPLAGRVEGFS